MKKPTVKKTLNFKFIVILLLGTAIVGVGVHFLHAFQVERNASALLEQANRARDQEELVKAAGYYRRYLGFQPTDNDALEQFGRMLNKIGEKNKSLKQRYRAFLILERVLVRDPDRPKLRREQIELAMIVGAFTEAKEHIKILDPKEKDSDLLQKRAQCEAINKEYAAAATTFQKAIELDTSNLKLYEQLAALYRLRLEQVELADKTMEKMLKANKSFPAYLSHARYYLSLGEKDANYLKKVEADVTKAEELARKAGTKEADKADVILVASELLRMQDKPDAARQKLEAGLKEFPSNKSIYLSLINLEIKAKKIHQAEEKARQAIQALPDDKDVQLTLGNVLVLPNDKLDESKNKKRLEEAETIVSRLREAKYNPFQVNLLQAQVYARQGEWGKAEPILRDMYSQVSRESPYARSIYFSLAECYERLGNPDQAFVIYEDAYQLDPLSFQARLGKGASYMALGQFDKAAAQYREILALKDAPAAARLFLVRALVFENLRLPATKRDWSEIKFQLSQARRELKDSVEVPILQAQLMVLENENNLDKATDHLKAEILLNPDNARLRIALASLAGRKDAEKALQVLDDALHDPKLKDNVDLTLARIRYLSRLPEKKAHDRLAQMQKQTSFLKAQDKERLLGELASAYYRLDDKTKAIKLLDRLAKEQPNNLGLRLVLFDINLEAGNKDRLTEIIAELKGIEGDAGAYWRFAEASRLVSEVKKDANKNLDNADHRLLAQANKYLIETARLREKWFRVPALQGEIAAMEGFKIGAIDHYQKAVALGDRRPTIIRNLWNLLVDQKRFAEAGKVVVKLLDQEDILVTAGLGKFATNALLRQDPGRAENLALRAVPKNSKQSRDHLWLGQVLWSLGKNERAQVQLESACQLKPDAPENWTALIRFLVATKQKDKAKNQLVKAREHLLKLPIEKSALALADCEEALGNLSEAEKQITIALANKEDNPLLIVLAAGFHLRHGQLDRASGLLKKFTNGDIKVNDDQAAWARRKLAAIHASHLSYKEFQQGLKLIDKNLKLRNNRNEDLLTKANMLARRAMYREEAIKLFENLQRQPGLLGVNDLFTLAQLYEADDNFERFQLTMLDILRLPEGKKPAFYAYYARRLLSKHDVGIAQRYLNLLEKEEPASLRTMDLKARILHAQGKHDEAITLLREYAQRKDASVGQIALLLQLLGEKSPAQTAYFQEAEKLYKKYIKGSEKQSRYLLYAEFLARQKRTVAALDQCEQALKLKGPSAAVLPVCVATLRYSDAGKQSAERVDRWINAALAEKPNSADVLMIAADFRDFQGDFKAASGLYRKILAKNPRNLIALNNLAWILAVKNRQGDEALKLLNRAMDLVGPTAELLDTRGIVYLTMNQTEKALQDLEQAVSLNKSPTRYFHRAQIHLRRGNLSKARLDLAKAQEMGLTAHILHPLERREFEDLLRALKKS